MYKIYFMNVGEKEQIIIHGEEKVVDQYAKDVFVPSDYGTTFDFNTSLQYEKAIEELQKEFPNTKVVRVK